MNLLVCVEGDETVSMHERFIERQVGLSVWAKRSLDGQL